ncbi:hypothetical protein [Aristaeella hokkaidonensis]|uniref:Uncharacterized protein n=1 Tax=Aristaeella hokkaidonensis TaxID=3046382 RepID=A0AC61NKY0_9FIRM|nr:hypothetical protein [Aristaeella hokkaidonensis]QUC66923.1 hypothetical protein JYE49_13965 [Aristaeella hokkaidonensis]SNT94445.1 hypothetical protein SAMN06297421_105102 [Aristaeella hokkaidonensis]
MSIDLKNLQRTLADNKVYDAWPYVLGLRDSMRNMHLSFDLAKAVYKHRKDEIEHFNQSMLQEAASAPGTKVQVTWQGMTPPFQDIAGIEVDDTVLMEKSAVDFFHYAHMSVDCVCQIVNSALFGDQAIEEEKVSSGSLHEKVATITQFGTLLNIMDNGFLNNELIYVREFDNYTKHIKINSFTISNSLFFGNKADYVLCAFSFKGNDYPEFEAITKMDTVMHEVENYIEAVLAELIIQVPNAVGTSSRHHSVSFKSQLREHDGKSYVDYIVYFLEVKNGITDLPSEISVLPLVIKPDGTIESRVLDMDTLFVTIEGQEEGGICGIAKIAPDQRKAAAYRKYTIQPASVDDFYDYLSTFKDDYANHQFRFKAMEGSIVIYKMDEEAQEKPLSQVAESEETEETQG